MRRPLALTAWLTLGCFSGPAFRPPEAPTLPLRAPAAPSPPSPVEAQRPAGGERRLTSARAADDLRARTLALVLRGPDGLRERAWPALARLLLEARFTRVLPPTLDAVRASVSTERGGARTTVEGDLPTLLHLRAETPADVLLVVELAESAEAQEASVAFPAGALEGYEGAYAQFVAAVGRAREQARGAVAAWSEGVRSAEAAYLQRGGAWQDARDLSAREQARDFASRAQAYDAQLDEALRRAVPPGELVRRAAQQQAASRASVTLVRARARLTDLTAGRTDWMLELTDQGADSNGALAAVLARLVAELPAGAPAPEALPVP